jgi:hypothetical protein
MQQPIPVLHFNLAFLAPSFSALLRLLFRGQGFAFGLLEIAALRSQ